MMALNWCVFLGLVMLLLQLPCPVEMIEQCSCEVHGFNAARNGQQDCGGVCHDDQVFIEALTSDEGESRSVLKILANFWVGFKNQDYIDDFDESIFGNDSLVGICRFCYLFNGYNFAVSDSVVLYEDGQFATRCRNNATGFFCSQCEDEYYHNMGKTCVHKCDHIGRDWFIFILSQFVPILFFFFVFFYANFSLISGPLNAAIFSAQMLSTTMDLDQESFPLANITNSTTAAYSLTAVYKFLYGPFTLDFFSPFTDDLCLFREKTYLYYFIAEYIVAVFPLLLVSILALLYSLKRCNDKNFMRLKQCNKFFKILLPADFDLVLQSSRNILASFVFLAYVKFSWLSTILVTPIPLYNYNNELDSLVLYLDPTVNYFDHNGVGVAIVAFICLLFILLLPTILLFFRHSTVKHQQNRCLRILNVFLEPFQYSFIEKSKEEDLVDLDVKQRFKECINTNKYPWIPAVYIALRILMLLIFFDVNITRRLILQQIVCIIAAMFFIGLQPYRTKRWINKLDAFIFLVLGFINTLALYQNYLAMRSWPLSHAAFAVQYILIFFPLFWIITYIILIFKKRWSKRKKLQQKQEVLPTFAKDDQKDNKCAPSSTNEPRRPVNSR